MFELLPTTQANSVLPVELPHCGDTVTNTEIHSFQKFTINSDVSLGGAERLPKKFTFDATANLGGDEVAPRPR